eukprot:165646-Chlamydomonas_euryale.AAC.3
MCPPHKRNSWGMPGWERHACCIGCPGGVVLCHQSLQCGSRCRWQGQAGACQPGSDWGGGVISVSWQSLSSARIYCCWWLTERTKVVVVVVVVCCPSSRC